MNDQQRQAQSNDFRIAQGVYVGRLMSPGDVASSTAGREGAVYRELQRWTFCGDVSPAVFDLLYATRTTPGTNERVTAFWSPQRRGYLVLTHQVGMFQHRFFVPLFDAKVQECIGDISAESSLGYSLSGEGNQAIVWRSVLGARDFLPLRTMCKGIAEGEEEAALDEYARMLGEVRNPERIPSLIAGLGVRYASVSAITPEGLISRLVQRYGASA